MPFIHIEGVGLMRAPLLLPRYSFVEGFEVIEPEPFAPSERWAKTYKAPKISNGYPLPKAPVPPTFKIRLVEGWSTRGHSKGVIGGVSKLLAEMERSGVPYTIEAPERRSAGVA